MSSGSETKAQIASLKRKEAELTAQAKREKKRQKHSHGDNHIAKLLHKAGLTQLTPKLAKPAMQLISDFLILYELCEFCDDVVVSYALGLGRPCRFQNHGYMDMWDVDLRSNIAAGFGLVYQALELSFLVANLANCPQKRLDSLCKYIIEYKLFLWMVELNCDKGVAPPILQLLAQATKFISILAPSATRESLKR